MNKRRPLSFKWPIPILNWFLISTIAFIPFRFSIVDGSECEFRGFRASCMVRVHSIEIESTIVVNNCHLPVDVTFTVQVANSSTNWQYTFVTTNLAETQTIAGLEEELSLHVVLQQNHPQELQVKADFHLKKIKQQSFFINSAVDLGNQDQCVKKDDSLSQQIAICVIVAFVLALIVSGVAYFYCRHKRNTFDRLTLMANSESGCPGTRPYQEGAAADHGTNNSHGDGGCRRKTTTTALKNHRLRVEFKNTKRSEDHDDVVIENSFAAC